MSQPKWYADGLRFACTQCGNCCRNHGEYTYVYLTEVELREIPAHLGLSRKEFLERSADDYRNSPAAQRGLEDGLAAMRDHAKDLLQQDARELVERFGQMGRRKLQLAG